MNSSDIRQSFLKFFEDRNHEVVESSPVVPQNDPTLLFTNAGMNQFKDLLLGNEVRDYKRAASSQKCIRAGGKHNDLDEVGKDGRHLTFFEMLGNWSFGDYYKRDAIVWAWDYILNVLKFDPAVLYVTVHHSDEDSLKIWRDEVGVEPDRILKLGDKDNFWSMGPTGPCGPCTEIHIDLHPEAGAFDFVEGYDDDRVIEFWNLVFMESNRNEDGSMEPLPLQSVDTGMGLERVTAVLEGVDSVFHTDIFRPVLQKTADLLGTEVNDWPAFFKTPEFVDYSVIADHVRSVVFSLCDGAKFSNEGTGYVVRRILRRAVRHGRRLGFEGPFMHELVAPLVQKFGDVYPELKAQGEKAAELVRLEEERFFRNIDRGMELFETAAAEAKAAGQTNIGGDKVFDLHTTYGFPPDLTQIMAEEHGLGVDLEEYAKLLNEFRETSKGKDMYATAAGVGDWTTIHEGPSSTFVGYDNLESQTRIMKSRHLEDARYELILEETPFYAESGGQVGDVGQITGKGLTFKVLDTQKSPIGIVHSVELTNGTVTDENIQGVFHAHVDEEARRLTISNHTATHLLHAALRDIVSDQVFQAGSLVSPDKLRFDFSHGEPLTDEQVDAIETRVNQQIREGHEVVAHQDVDRETAVEEMGAMAIFGEKYGDKVRVVEIPGESVELCGGTHVQNTADINLFRITSEAGVAAGIRRIEAVTNETAFATFQSDKDLVQTLSRMLKTEPARLMERIEGLQAERGELEKQVQKLSAKLASADSADLVDEATEIEGVKVIAKQINADTRDQLLQYADQLRSKMDEGVVLLASEIDGKAALLCLVTDSAFKNRKLKAGDLINEAASYVEGRGGGRPTLAQAGGTKLDGIHASVDNFPQIVRSALGA